MRGTGRRFRRFRKRSGKGQKKKVRRGRDGGRLPVQPSHPSRF